MDGRDLGRGQGVWDSVFSTKMRQASLREVKAGACDEGDRKSVV